MNKHTPGPWVYFEKNDSAFWGEIRSAETFDLIASQPPFDNREADFLLMAAAPDLLEALQMVAAEIANGEGARSTKEIRQIKNALATAKEVTVK